MDQGVSHRNRTNETPPRVSFMFLQHHEDHVSVERMYPLDAEQPESRLADRGVDGFQGSHGSEAQLDSLCADSFGLAALGPVGKLEFHDDMRVRAPVAFNIGSGETHAEFHTFSWNVFGIDAADRTSRFRLCHSLPPGERAPPGNAIECAVGGPEERARPIEDCRTDWRHRKRTAQIRSMPTPDCPSLHSLYVAGLAERSDGEVVRLDDEESRHARSLRLDSGDAIVLTDGRGTRRAGRLGAASDRRREVTIGRSLPVIEPLAVELAVAVGNRTHTLWLVEKAAEFGIRRLSPVETERSRSVSDAGRSVGFWTKAHRRALAAVKQSGGAWLPEFGAVVDLNAFLDRTRTSGDPAIVLDIDGAPLRNVLPHPLSPILLFVGPEGGLTRAELEACVAAGFSSGRLGPTVLRFETAAVAALAVVAQEREITGVPPGKPQGERT